MIKCPYQWVTRSFMERTPGTLGSNVLIRVNKAHFQSISYSIYGLSSLYSTGKKYVVCVAYRMYLLSMCICV